MHVFISGGCKNGKSYIAQRIARSLGAPLYYVATMIPADDEDRARICRHLREREGWGFVTVEQPTFVSSCLGRADPLGTFLLDSVTAAVANAMFRPDGGADLSAHIAVADDLTCFMARTQNAVLVSDYIYSDALLYDEWTEAYRRSLAYVDRAVARAADVVLEVTNGTVTAHKGEIPL